MDAGTLDTLRSFAWPPKALWHDSKPPDSTLSGALLLQWFEEDYGELETEMRKLRAELRQPA